MMRRILLRRTVHLLAILTVVLAGPGIALACNCLPYETVLDDYERADLVILARLSSFNRAPKSRSGSKSYITGATMVVEQVFKGNVKTGDKLTFRQGNFVSCDWTFDGEPIGEQYLLYVYKPKKPSAPWYISTCTRSRHLEDAEDDLLYLNNIEKRRGQTRVSGTVLPEGDLSKEDRKIHIRGNNRTYVATTDKNGVFELYGLSPGEYVVEPELPFGWKVSHFHLTRPATFEEVYFPSNRIGFALQPGKHFGINIRLALSNYVSGTVYDSIGKPLRMVSFSLLSTDEKNFIPSILLPDEQGHFRIDSVEPGTYFLIIKYIRKPPHLESVPPFYYYPGVTEREKATPISVKFGENVTGLKAVLP